MKNIPVSEFINISSDCVVIDVRTPAEFEKGHIVGAVNMPLFTNEERASVGTIYKRQGKDEAVLKGLDFVGSRMSSFVRFAKKAIKGKAKDTKIILYCWRGGMRSNSVAWLLTQAGFNVDVILGGYKAYRRSFISRLNTNYWKFIILGGPTGCGKTDILYALEDKGEQMIDLEEAAKHRGSAFGIYGHSEPQPSSEHFANIVYHRLLKLDNTKYIWCEGESMSIGKVFMPQELYNSIQGSKFAYFSLPEEVRLDHIVRDYGDCPKDTLIQCFTNITKRLGNDRAKLAIELVEQDNIREAARIGLYYYDKGYNHSIEGRRGEIFVRLEMGEDNPSENAKALIEAKNNKI